MRAVVVGAGIAGLASALALTRTGWEVEILERAPELTEVGAGLSLWPNALRALDALGVGDAVRNRSALAGQAGIRNPAGRWLTRTDTADIELRYGPTVMIHRADLLAVLRDAVPAGALHPGATVTSVRPDGTVQHSGGQSQADLVIGADGLRSVTRTSVWPAAPAPRYAGYAAWRLVTPPLPPPAAAETWGRGQRFAAFPLSDGRLYCYATANAPAGSANGGLEELRRRFGGWHDPIPALLDATDPRAVLYNDLYELPPLAAYVSGKVALAGDAAHAMTPNLGQGACQALEDAAVLGRVVASGAGLDAYDRQRRSRTQMISRRSHQIGAISQWSSPVAVRLRHAMLRLTPARSLTRSLAPILSWEP
jgi:2-polyprenyl-6-methoxyphenol hydroxylase-like FAD-dependent oxidoreductase